MSEGVVEESGGEVEGMRERVMERESDGERERERERERVKGVERKRDREGEERETNGITKPLQCTKLYYVIQCLYLIACFTTM